MATEWYSDGRYKVICVRRGTSIQDAEKRLSELVHIKGNWHYVALHVMNRDTCRLDNRNVHYYFEG